MSYLGSQPLAAMLPLVKGQNLSDLSDKAASRNNLGVLSKDETLLHTVPIGTILSFFGNSAPPGYLPCYGQVVNAATYPELVTFLNAGASSATLPDLRGEFLRGWDAGRGVDQGRNVRSWQKGSLVASDPTMMTPAVNGIINSDDATGSHLSRVGLDPVAETNYSDTRVAYTASGVVTTNLNAAGAVVGSTRPRNVAVLYCIKAYGAYANSTTLDVANLAQDLSMTVKTTDFLGAKSINGWQYINGLLVQWGRISCPVGTTTGKADITFPVAFPRECFLVSASIGILYPSYDQLTSGAASDQYRKGRQEVSIGMPSATGAPGQYFVDNNPGDSRVIQWTAIGY